MMDQQVYLSDALRGMGANTNQRVAASPNDVPRANDLGYSPNPARANDLGAGRTQEMVSGVAGQSVREVAAAQAAAQAAAAQAAAAVNMNPRENASGQGNGAI